MNYQKEEIKQGITLHQIHTENFKTNLYAIFLAIPLEREKVTLDALIGAVLRRGTQRFQTQEAISKELEGMYGASFNCGIEKTGDNHILKFYLETLSEEFLPEPEKLNEKWEEVHDKLAYYIEHDELEKVENNLTSCRSLTKTGNFDLAINEVEKMAFVLNHITDKYSFNWVNIF